MSTDRKKSPSGLLPAACAIVALGLVAPVCGIISQQRHLAPIKSSARPTRIVGIGLNCHSEKLPVDKLRALGIRWVRLDTGRGLTSAQIRDLVSYYRDFGQLWIDHQLTGDPVKTARMLVDAGVQDIEVLNEPEQNDVTAQQYAQKFKAIRTAVGTRARLYGPVIGVWTTSKSYVDAAIDAGMSPDVLSIHGYGERAPEDFKPWIDAVKRYGIPVVVTELAFDGPSTTSMSLEDFIVRTNAAMGTTPWCYYDGPNPNDNRDQGIFDFNPSTKRFDVPNSHYWSFLKAADRISKLKAG